MTVLNLFRGQCIGAKVDIVSSDCIITLDLEDYNRLPPLIAVGAPGGDLFFTQADGTVVFADGKAQLNGVAVALQAYPLGYWPANGLPDLDLTTGFLSDDVPDTLVIDFGTALSDLKSFVDAQIQFIGAGVRWWLGLPPTGDGLILYVVDFNDTDQTDLLPAPYEIDNDNPDWVTRVMSEKLSVSWDWAALRDSGYIRGGTPPGEGSGWGFGIGGGRMGDAYIDSPGSITLADRTVIAAWHEAQKFIAQLSATSTMPSGWVDPDYGNPVVSQPWHVGQTVLVTSSRHSRLLGMVAGDRVLDARPCVIQSVTGRLVTPSGGLVIKIDGVALTKPFEWKTLTFEEQLNGAGKATVVIHLLGSGAEIGLPPAPEDLVVTPGDTFASLTWSGIPDDDKLGIGLDADVWITVDDEDPADIEWDLTVGTMPRGTLTRELAKPEVVPPVQPVYHFEVEFDRNLPIGKTGLVKAQLSDKANSGQGLSGVPMEWIILANDIDDNPLDTTGWLSVDPAVGVTDSGGAVFIEWTPGAGASAVEISAVALPI